MKYSNVHWLVCESLLYQNVSFTLLDLQPFGLCVYLTLSLSGCVRFLRELRSTRWRDSRFVLCVRAFLRESLFACLAIPFWCVRWWTSIKRRKGEERERDNVRLVRHDIPKEKESNSTFLLRCRGTTDELRCWEHELLHHQSILRSLTHLVCSTFLSFPLLPSIASSDFPLHFDASTNTTASKECNWRKHTRACYFDISTHTHTRITGRKPQPLYASIIDSIGKSAVTCRRVMSLDCQERKKTAFQVVFCVSILKSCFDQLPHSLHVTSRNVAKSV